VAWGLIEHGELSGDEIDRLIEFGWIPSKAVH
jgi:hypothetical protein